MPNQTPPGSLATEGTFAQLMELISSSGGLGSSNIHLYQSNFTPQQKNIYADYTAVEANYAGYSAQPLTWSGVAIDADGDPLAVSDRAFFQPSSTRRRIRSVERLSRTLASPVGSVVVLDFFQFGNPVSLSTPYAFVGVIIAGSQPNGGGYALVDYCSRCRLLARAIKGFP